MTESTTHQELQQVQALNPESLEPIAEVQPEEMAEQLGNEAENAELTTGDILKDYKTLGSELGVSADSIRKNIKAIEKICEGFVTGLELTRKVGRKVMVTPEGQQEVRKFREIGAEAYIRSLEDVFGGAEDEVIDAPQPTQPTAPQEPAGEMVVRDDRTSAALTQTQQQNAIAQQASTLASCTEQAATHHDKVFANQLQAQEMQGLQDGATLALQHHAAKVEGYHRTMNHLDQTFLTRTTGGTAAPNLSGLEDFTQQVGKSEVPPKPNSQQFLDDLLGQFQ